MRRWHACARGSCIIDGEAVACDDKGVASFDLVRHHRHNDRAFLYAFDLIELNGDDLRNDPLEVRKAMLASVAAKAQAGIRFNEHMEGDGRKALRNLPTLGNQKTPVTKQGRPLPFGDVIAFLSGELARFDIRVLLFNRRWVYGITAWLVQNLHVA